MRGYLERKLPIFIQIISRQIREPPPPQQKATLHREKTTQGKPVSQNDLYLQHRSSSSPILHIRSQPTPPSGPPGPAKTALSAATTAAKEISNTSLEHLQIHQSHPRRGAIQASKKDRLSPGHHRQTTVHHKRNPRENQRPHHIYGRSLDGHLEGHWKIHIIRTRKRPHPEGDDSRNISPPNVHNPHRTPGLTRMAIL